MRRRSYVRQRVAQKGLLCSVTAVPELSIVLVHFRTGELTGECLRSLLDHLTVCAEIIVVDNDPAEGSGARLAARFPETRWIEAPDNPGFGASCNRGMRAARGEVIWLLNTDTVQIQRAADEIVAFFRTHPGVDLMCHRLLNADRSLQQNLFDDALPSVRVVLRQQWLQSPFGRLTDSRTQAKLPLQGRQVMACSGASVALRKKVFVATGGFDPDFFLYCEETEWMRRRIAGNYVLWYEPSIAVIHLSGGSGGAWSQWQNRLSYFLYLYKFSVPLFRLYLFLERVNRLAWLAARCLCLQFGKARDYKRLSQRLVRQAARDIPAYPPDFGARGNQPLRFSTEG